MQSTDNEIINLALMRLSRRSEKVNPEALVRTFVDVGPLFNLLSIVDNQILFGRRGTGKTHALGYLAEIRKTSKDAPIYLDLSNLGSSGGIYSDRLIPIADRATRLLVDTLLVLHDGLYEFCVENAEKYDLSVTGPILDDLAQAITEVRVVGPVEHETTSQDKYLIKGEEGTGVKLSSNGVDIGIYGKTSSHEEWQTDTKYKVQGEVRHTIHFGSVRLFLEKLSKAIAPSRIWLLLDEWSSIPFELQPYLADLLRRSIFPVRNITVKIGAIEYRSSFKITEPQGNYIGIELGADISADLNLDDFLVFDNDPTRARDFYKSLFHRHVMGQELQKEELSGLNENELIGHAFTQVNAFDELVRAAEGVPRDAIHISSLAAQYSLKERIGIPQVRKAAKNWYQTGKESAIRARNDALNLLHWIIDKVIGDRKARAFLLRSNANHPLIEELFDARVLHILKRGVATHDQPGVRYDVYKLDYGCYVDLMATSRAPMGLIPVDEQDDPSGFVEVPKDDYRSIRRAILTLSEFEEKFRS